MRCRLGDSMHAGKNLEFFQLLYLEDLDVQPGDFVSYYVRARDLTRGTRPNEARSDIFFLEVKPYEQEFALAQSQGNMPGGNQSGYIVYNGPRKLAHSDSLEDALSVFDRKIRLLMG